MSKTTSEFTNAVENIFGIASKIAQSARDKNVNLGMHLQGHAQQEINPKRIVKLLSVEDPETLKRNANILKHEAEKLAEKRALYEQWKALPHPGENPSPKGPKQRR